MKKKDIITLCALLSACSPALAQEQTQGSTQPQLEGSALNYMLQRPKVSKFYAHKRFMDHMFMDFGLGGNLLGRHNVKIGPMAELGLGDWVSPEHGWRINMYGGAYKISGKKVKYASAALDYMLNISAIAQPGTSYRQRFFELYGIAGIDATYSRENGNNDHGFGAHLGLRSQFAFSDITYVYLEPRVGVVQDNVSQVESWRNLRPVASLSMGFGVRMPDVRKGGRNIEGSHGSFADGLFASAMAGPMYLGSKSISKWKHNKGMTVGVALGKWFDYCNGARLTLNTTTLKQDDWNRVKAVGARLEYMLNLHNAFGGWNPDRRFWVNAMAGVSYNYSTDRISHNRYTFGGGAGLQANLRLSRDISAFIEPRIDVYNRRWAPSERTFEKIDATASLLAGFTYTYHEDFSRNAHKNEKGNEMRKSSFGMYGGAAVRLFQYNDIKRYMPVARVSYTHWTAPMLGWRYSLQGMFGKPVNARQYGAVTGGVDWMTDLTAVTYGCDNSRVLSVRTLAGFNIGADHSGYTRLASDIHAGGQLAFRLSPRVDLTAETQLGYEFTPHYNGRRSHRVQPQVTLGIEYNLQRAARNKDLDEKRSQRNYVFLSAGSGIYSGNMGQGISFGKKLTILSDIGYGHWFSELSGLQLSAANTVVPTAMMASKTITSVRADYMLDLKSAVTGESSENDVVQLTGLVGASANISTKKDRKNKFAPGIHAALQAGFKVSNNVELYFEPSATAFTKQLEGSDWCSPAEVELRFSIGTKYHF